RGTAQGHLADAPGAAHLHDRGPGVRARDGRDCDQPGLRVHQAGVLGFRLRLGARGAPGAVARVRAPAREWGPARLAQRGAGGTKRPGNPVPAERCGADAARRVERRAIVSESRVRVSDETEEVPAKDGEVGEADVSGEFGEPEESGEPG